MKVPPIVLSAFRCMVTGLCLLGAANRGAFADVVIEWNVAMTDYATPRSPAPLPPFAEVRVYAMAHLAMFAAIAEAQGVCTHRWNHRGLANADAAAAQAAHNVLVHEFADGAAAFDALLATELGAIPNSPAKTKGLAIGADAAADILAARANDGAASSEGPYTPGTNPGDYQLTQLPGVPFLFAQAVNWGKVTPFSLKRGSQFRAPAPYKVTDLDYTFDFNEIKSLGSADSLARSDDQTAVAIFWYESSGLGWNRVARILAAQHSDSLFGHARLFATLNVAMTDATIAAFDSKYFYNFWRPITAIQAAATDGNDLTTADLAWNPVLPTPPVPDYPSNHASMGGAASTVLISFFGDQSTFTFTSTFSVPFPFVGSRTFHKISDAAKENAISRMLVGIHFRLACEMGLEQGVDVGTWVVHHGVQP